MSSIEELKHLQIPLKDISVATNEFSDVNYIACGGFGKVYKGILKQHGLVAIKRLDRENGQGDHEFITEIALLSVYKHENIAYLHGFCDEDGERILVYKHEGKGSLDKHISNKDLTWIQRLQICIDAARGLKYLHDDVGPQHRILHRDVKSSNILLDEKWKAKISDFGLSKIGPANVKCTFLISKALGTIGYVDPEYVNTGVLTKESDVFSFGVVLFEVLCGRPTQVTSYNDERQFLYTLVQNHYKKKTLHQIVHSDLQKQINESSLVTFLTIAYQCFKERKERPRMKKVVEQLQKALDYQLDITNNIVDHDFAGPPRTIMVRELVGFYDEEGKKDDCKEEQADNDCMVKDLSSISTENKKLTEMLTVMCENYNGLQNHLMRLMQEKELPSSNPNKRKLD